MKQLLIFGVLIFFINGCSSDVKKTEEPKEEVAVLVEPNRILTLEIDGMVCKMGCGGAIRKELKATNAVANVDFDFEEERPSNNAKISFDKDKISVDKIISIITSINDGQFKVGKSSSEDLIESSTPDTKDENDSEDIKVNVSSSGFEMPNLLDVFSDLITK